jgi:hypothetical protein
MSYLDNIKINFIFCTGRTGSSMLTAILNEHPEIISPVEETFLLYFYDKYKDKIYWTEKDIELFGDEFWLLATKQQKTKNYLEGKDALLKAIMSHAPNITYLQLCKIIYLNFYPGKDKSSIKLIFDKQLHFILHLKTILKIVPDAKIIILSRDYLDNIVTKQKRGTGLSLHTAYLAKVWDIIYGGAIKLKKNKNAFFIKYEELVSSPEQKIKELCAFLNVSFLPKMLKFNESFKSFVEDAESKYGNESTLYLRKFHSKMLEPINTKNVGVGQELSANEIQLSTSICQYTASELGYTPRPETVSKSKLFLLYLKNVFYIIAPYFLYVLYKKLYLVLPFSLKIRYAKIKKRLGAGR